jgi:hypothetical protein
MGSNPELHYLEHVQNTSISKHCFKFAKAPRFLQHKRTYPSPHQVLPIFTIKPNPSIDLELAALASATGLR